MTIVAIYIDTGFLFVLFTLNLHYSLDKLCVTVKLYTQTDVILALPSTKSVILPSNLLSMPSSQTHTS